MVTNEFLNDYLFHLNPYENRWYGFKREHATLYFNNREGIPKGELYSALSSWEVKDLIINHHTSPKKARVI